MKPDIENAVWDPEESYQQARSSGLRLLTVILLIIAAGAACLYLSLEHKKKTGEAELRASMSFEEADRTLQQSGYIPLDRIRRNGSQTYRTYDSRILFGCVPAYSMLVAEEQESEKQLQLTHVFEESGKHGMADPGEIFLKLKEELTKLYGTPEEQRGDSVKYWQWRRKDGSLILLGYVAQSMPLLYYLWTDSGLSAQI